MVNGKRFVCEKKTICQAPNIRGMTDFGFFVLDATTPFIR